MKENCGINILFTKQYFKNNDDCDYIQSLIPLWYLGKSYQ